MEINPRDKVALAVRTQYDEKKLRAKGFIYFSPDSGKMRVKGDEKIEIIWKYQKIFLGILKHEWGHVLGVTHDVKPFARSFFSSYCVLTARATLSRGLISISCSFRC